MSIRDLQGGTLAAELAAAAAARRGGGPPPAVSLPMSRRVPLQGRELADFEEAARSRAAQVCWRLPHHCRLARAHAIVPAVHPRALDHVPLVAGFGQWEPHPLPPFQPPARMCAHTHPSAMHV